MNEKRKTEIFSAGCPVCKEAIDLINNIACPSCEVHVLDMHDPEVTTRATSYGIKRVPSVVIDGKLADCCEGGGVDENTFRRLGVGTPLRA